MPRTAGAPRKSATTGKGKRAKAATKPKKESKASSSEKPKKSVRGTKEPLTQGQYDALLCYVQWQFPRSPKKPPPENSKLPKDLRTPIANAFRNLAHFRSAYLLLHAFIVGCHR